VSAAACSCMEQMNGDGQCERASTAQQGGWSAAGWVERSRGGGVQQRGGAQQGRWFTLRRRLSEARLIAGSTLRWMQAPRLMRPRARLAPERQNAYGRMMCFIVRDDRE
jgi:hypothetical protein